MRFMIFKTTGDCSFTFAWNVQRLLLHFCKNRTFDFKLPKKIQYKVAMENFMFLLALFFLNLEKKMNLNFLFKDLMLQNILNKFGKLDGMCVWTFGETKYCYIYHQLIRGSKLLCKSNWNFDTNEKIIEN